MEIGTQPFIVAELSGNHGGSLERALKLIGAAASCCVSAIKIQTYEPHELNDPANNAIYEKCKIPRDWYPWLFNEARKYHVPLFSSVFSIEAIDFLEAFNCPAYKLASPESTRLPRKTYRALCKRIGDTEKPLWASSGRDDWDDTIEFGPRVILYCVAGYPATISDDDVKFFKDNRGYRIAGFSDHTADICSPLAMIGAGARVIEKHFKLDDDCIDAAFSLNPEQMATLCRIAHR